MQMRFAVVGCILFVAGCGTGVAPVSGKVMLDGKPLANAVVIFSPDREAGASGPGSQGKTDANGNFSLRLMTKDQAGAVVGKHKVTISLMEGEDSESSAKPKTRTELLAPMYNSHSKLTFDVPSGGTTAANFELTKPAVMPTTGSGSNAMPMPKGK